MRGLVNRTNKEGYGNEQTFAVRSGALDCNCAVQLFGYAEFFREDDAPEAAVFEKVLQDAKDRFLEEDEETPVCAKRIQKSGKPALCEKVAMPSGLGLENENVGIVGKDSLAMPGRGGQVRESAYRKRLPQAHGFV
jgi:hypothetical protein